MYTLKGGDPDHDPAMISVISAGKVPGFKHGP
jgi:hypothetical protein